MIFKKILAATVCASAMLSAAALDVDQLSPSTRAALSAKPSGLSLGGDRSSSPLRAAEEEEAENCYAIIIQVDSQEAADQLLGLGVTIFHQRKIAEGNILLLTAVPESILYTALGVSGVIDAASACRLTSCLDVAREVCHVDQAHEGAGFTRPYTGKGIVAGFSDLGFYPSHIAFGDRVRMISDYQTLHAEKLSATTADEIGAWVTDNPQQSHATHVAGIFAGGYTGNPYCGAAPGCDIAATTSDLSDVGILSGVEDIIAYAKEHNQPAIINLSLASYNGPHDGTDLSGQYLSACAKDAIIVVSAGNTGHRTTYAQHTFTDAAPLARVRVKDLDSGYHNVRGQTDIWSDSPQPLTFRFEIRDNDTNEIVYTSAPIGGDTGASQIVITSDADPDMAKYLTGYMQAFCGVSPNNNRYNVITMYNTSYTVNSQSGGWGRYVAQLNVTGPAGEHVQFFADGSSSDLKWASVNTSADGSINNMACAPGVISVGSYFSRGSTPLANGTTSPMLSGVGAVRATSSYSNAPGLPRLPHFCAPGCVVVSAISTPYAENYPNEAWVEITREGDSDYYWLAWEGTSMASPFAAGIFALWLEANPDLTSDDMVNIAQSTADKNFADISNPRWNAGLIDANAGLKEALRLAATSSAEFQRSPLVLVEPNRSISVTFPGGKESPVSVYALSGVLVDHTSPLSPGVYIVALPGFSTKVLVK